MHRRRVGRPPGAGCSDEPGGKFVDHPLSDSQHRRYEIPPQQHGNRHTVPGLTVQFPPAPIAVARSGHVQHAVGGNEGVVNDDILAPAATQPGKRTSYRESRSRPGAPEPSCARRFQTHPASASSRNHTRWRIPIFQTSDTRLQRGRWWIGQYSTSWSTAHPGQPRTLPLVPAMASNPPARRGQSRGNSTRRWQRSLGPARRQGQGPDRNIGRGRRTSWAHRYGKTRQRADRRPSRPVFAAIPSVWAARALSTGINSVARRSSPSAVVVSALMSGFVVTRSALSRLQSSARRLPRTWRALRIAPGQSERLPRPDCRPAER